MNKGIKRSLEEGCVDLLRFMKDNPEYADIEWIKIKTLNKNEASMVVQFDNGHQEERIF